mmetsp:Transcript_20836/g.49678  ORF Transcript_20836/g.49678 Transcript_20836/m.49678 type:complete len:205 (+) Transcript_20836:1158-1772(+)
MQSTSLSAGRTILATRARRLSGPKPLLPRSSSTCVERARQPEIHRRAPMLKMRCAVALLSCAGPARQRACRSPSCASMTTHAAWLWRAGSERAEAVPCASASRMLRGRSARWTSLATTGSAAASDDSSRNTRALLASFPARASAPSISISCCAWFCRRIALPCSNSACVASIAATRCRRLLPSRTASTTACGHCLIGGPLQICR